MKKYLFLVIFFSLIFGSTVLGAGDISYPVKELGNCKDKQECKTYCDKKENMLSCVNFAEQNGLMSKEEANMSKKIIPDLINNQTPGGCKTPTECREYCQGSTEHIDECVSFAKKNDILPKEELAEAEKVLGALKQGAKLPGGCKNKKDCESYCNDATHIDECLAFAEAGQMMNPKEIAEAKKIAPLMKAGKMPGNCKTKEECNAFCDNEVNIDVCINFSIEAGFMKQEEATMVKKTGLKGPGGCKGKEECEAFCNKEENEETCLNFAVSKDLIPKEDLKNMKEGSGKFTEGLNSLPSESKTLVEQCIKNKIGEEKYNKVVKGEAVMDKNMGSAIQSCFGSSMKDSAQGMIPQGIPQNMPSMQQNIQSGGKPIEGMPNISQNIQSGEKPMGEMPPKVQQIPQGTQNGMGMGMGTPSNIPQGEIPLNMQKELKEMLPPKGIPSTQDIQKLQQEAMKSIPQGMVIPQNISIPNIPQMGSPQN